MTSIQFCYSTSSLTNCTGGTVSTVAGSNPTASGSGSTAETATLSSLSAGTTYYVNLEGTSGGVTYYGTPTSFTTYAANGSGTIAVSPTTEVAGSTSDTLTFTYTAATGGVSGGELTVAVPTSQGWLHPDHQLGHRGTYDDLQRNLGDLRFYHPSDQLHPEQRNLHDHL